RPVFSPTASYASISTLRDHPLVGSLPHIPIAAHHPSPSKT
ncbi:hypothetical protein D030_1950B, partial [Vibrio parahaemolyticus AQ3810]